MVKKKGGGEQPDAKSADKPAEKPWITTLPGILTGVAAIVTAVGTVLAIVIPKITLPQDTVHETATPAVMDLPEFCDDYFDGLVQKTRPTIESGESIQIDVNPADPAKNTVGIKLVKYPDTVGAVKFLFHPDKDMFELIGVIDAHCFEVTDLSGRMVENGKEFSIELNKQAGTLRLSYDETAHALEVSFSILQ